MRTILGASSTLQQHLRALLRCLTRPMITDVVTIRKRERLEFLRLRPVQSRGSMFAAVEDRRSDRRHPHGPRPRPWDPQRGCQRMLPIETLRL